MPKDNIIEKEFKCSNETQQKIYEKFMEAVNAYDKASESNKSFPKKIKDKINQELKNSEKEIDVIRQRFNMAYISYKPSLKSTNEKEEAFKNQAQQNFNSEVRGLEKDLDVIFEKYNHRFQKINLEIKKFLEKFAQLKERMN